MKITKQVTVTKEIDVCNKCIKTELTESNTHRRGDKFLGATNEGFCDPCWDIIKISLDEESKIKTNTPATEPSVKAKNVRNVLKQRKGGVRRSPATIIPSEPEHEVAVFLKQPATELLNFITLTQQRKARCLTSLEGLGATIGEFVENFKPTEMVANLDGFGTVEVARIGDHIRRYIAWGPVRSASREAVSIKGIKFSHLIKSTSTGALDLLVVAAAGGGLRRTANQSFTKFQIDSLGGEENTRKILKSQIPKLQKKLQKKLKKLIKQM